MRLSPSMRKNFLSIRIFYKMKTMFPLVSRMLYHLNGKDSIFYKYEKFFQKKFHSFDQLLRNFFFFVQKNIVNSLSLFLSFLFFFLSLLNFKLGTRQDTRFPSKLSPPYHRSSQSNPLPSPNFPIFVHASFCNWKRV